MNKPLILFDSHFVTGKTFFKKQHNNLLYRPYGVDKWIINLTTVGEARINSSVSGFTVTRGDLLLFPPGVIHDYKDSDGKEWIHYWCYFSAPQRLHKLLKWRSTSNGIGRVFNNNEELTERLENIFAKVLNIYNSRINGYEDLCWNGLEEILLWTRTDESLKGSYPPPIEKAISLIMKRYSENLTIAGMAKACSLSPSRFSHLFREQLGVPPMKYLESVRIEKAREILSNQSVSIAEAGELVGYEDSLYFSKVFKKVSGMNPRQFRSAR